MSKFLNIKGMLLNNEQLENFLRKNATEQLLQNNSSIETYPIKRLENNFKYITNTYNLLNSNLKEQINIHPAGEWLLDNYYIIEETYRIIKKELSIKKYKKFIGIKNNEYQGFARIYVLANQIVSYTDGIIDELLLKKVLISYQKVKPLSMEELWNISIFLEISLIEKIREICEKIYYVELQKCKVEDIIKRLIENNSNIKNRNKIKYKSNKISTEPFVEYLSYRLNNYGKKGTAYKRVLEEEVEKTGTSVENIIKKEHYDIAMKKISIGNYIKSLKEVQRINFSNIFESVNSVEVILKQDPVNVYNNMTYETKEYYRNSIRNICNKYNLSEIYVANKALELCKKNSVSEKERHIGYYIIGDGVEKLKKELNIKNNKNKLFGKFYIIFSIIFTSLISLILSICLIRKTNNIILTILFIILSYISISEIVIKVEQYILSKKIKNKYIPKMDFSKGIPENCSTMVIVPTILKNKNTVKKMMEKLEIYYLANQSKNLYFTLLGDCSTSNKEKEEYDEEIINEGKKLIDILNAKYNSDIFNFIYRKRVWNKKEGSFLGWERKRGLIKEFNAFLLEKNIENTFLYNSFTNKKTPRIKYIITLDSDTELVLDSCYKLVGAMEHILNKPVIDTNKNIVIDGYGIMQPRIGININDSRKNIFTKIFTGMGGIDGYSNAISDVYQDNFGVGIFTGKGIYNLDVFYNVLENIIPENTVLSHDLLEGIYTRCGLVTDVILLDSCPAKFNSYIARNKRWIRGDWQIIKWLNEKIILKDGTESENYINELAKFQIFDNLRRSLLEISQISTFIILLFFYKYKLFWFYAIIFFSIFIDLVINVIDTIVFKKDGVKKQSSFENKLPGLRLSFVRNIVNYSSIIYRAYIYVKAIIITLYRVFKSKMHLLEWTTSEEMEKISKETLECYYKEMWINVFGGILLFLYFINTSSILMLLNSILFIISPFICYYISKKRLNKLKINEISESEKTQIINVANRTWKFFEDTLIQKNNFLPPDNYQENRKNKFVNRTSSTNIGLALISIISAYDLNFIDLDNALDLIINMLNTIKKLAKWNGHLYNWYNIETLDTLKPEYISTVDSGNFIGYLITLKIFLENINDELLIEKHKINLYINLINKLIKETDFSKLYNKDIKLFSIGFNIQDNKLTDSYYDLLASEARQASLVAIAKKDVPSEHWSHLSRVLTTMNGKKGLISWSGTSFEYLMPNINIKQYKGSILEESSKFSIMLQKKYCNALEIPWGISESAFNLKDLNGNYQYKAFGIPWIGLKRGLSEDIVVSSYGSILAINEEPRAVLRNLNILNNYNMFNKYGYYESIDFTPIRQTNGKKLEVVKTYMAHHQALILLSINNFINNNIIQDRFHSNPEIKAIDILLQEKMPEDIIITKRKKEKINRIKYSKFDYSYYKEINNNTISSNVISNGNYTIYINNEGYGFSKYKNILINRYKETNLFGEGIFFFIKSLNNNEIISTNMNNKINRKIIYTSNYNELILNNNQFEIKIKIGIDAEDNVEIRNIKIKNISNNNDIIELSSILEPVLSTGIQDYNHKAFNNLFIKYEKLNNGILINRNKRNELNNMYLATGLFFDKKNNLKLEYEIDKENLYGRLENNIPYKIKESKQFENKIGLTVNPIIAFKTKIKIKKGEEIEANYIVSVSEDKEETIEKLNKFSDFNIVKKSFNLSEIKSEETARYLNVTGNEMIIFQELLNYIFYNPQKYIDNNFRKYKQEELWKYGISGDNPIIVIKIKKQNEINIIYEVIKALKYYKEKNILIDIIILNNEENIYEKYVRDLILNAIAENGMIYLLNKEIFILNTIDLEDVSIFEFIANIVIDSNKGNLKSNLIEIKEKNNKKNVKSEYKKEENFIKYNIDDMNLKFKNSYGGFSTDGKEYIIFSDKKNPSVWSNILANKNFGTVITQNLGGYSWYKNCRLNRISRWSNDSILDTPSEIIYIQDEQTKKYWRIAENNVLVTHGFGYSKYEQKNNEIKQELVVFICKNKNIKINILKLTNLTNKTKKINLIYRVDTVLGEDETSSKNKIKIEYDNYNNIIYAQNMFNSNIEGFSYMYSSEDIKSCTNNIEKINIENNEPLEFGNSNQPCMALKISIELKPCENKEISFILGYEEQKNNFNIEYKNIKKCYNEYDEIVKYWNEELSKIKINTPSESFNIFLNGWCMYQTISSRINAKSGFFQSGGAIGFRDQLQDTLSLRYLNENFLKNQIILHAKHQFIEGDVEHWWHEETNRGIRTKFSDDRLWLVYAINLYINYTGDISILNEKIPYVEGSKLKENEDENYNYHPQSNVSESLLEHCIKAIEISLKFGKNNLPLIGTGDWNDGFSSVGNKGQGESVWLGFFIYDILNNFIKILEKIGNYELLIQKYLKILDELKISLNNNAWDGQWYRRAITDKNEILGSVENEECKIDSIAQSWSVISGVGEENKTELAMYNLENYLIDEKNGIIKLLTPAFEKSSIEPGYIKSYLPGVRENGGQYTHE